MIETICLCSTSMIVSGSGSLFVRKACNLTIIRSWDKPDSNHPPQLRSHLVTGALPAKDAGPDVAGEKKHRGHGTWGAPQWMKRRQLQMAHPLTLVVLHINPRSLYQRGRWVCMGLCHLLRPITLTPLKLRDLPGDLPLWRLLPCGGAAAALHTWRLRHMCGPVLFSVFLHRTPWDLPHQLCNTSCQFLGSKKVDCPVASLLILQVELGCCVCRDPPPLFAQDRVSEVAMQIAAHCATSRVI